MMSETEIKESLKQWIADKNGKVQACDLRGDTPVIEQRIISSLQIMDLILYLEKLRGVSIEVESLKPGVFKNIDAIYENFFRR